MDNQKKVLAKEALMALAEIESTTNMENLVKDNKIEFTVEDKIYRIRKPNFVERQTIDNARRKEYLRLINDDSFFFRKTWIDIYKKKNIDINAMENRVKLYQQEIEAVLLRLAVAVDIKDVETLKKEIYQIRDEQFSLSMEITDLLAHSIENQLLVFTNSYTTFVVLEEKVGEEYKKLFASYSDFMASDSKAIESAFMYINYLIYRHIGEGK
jgi:prolyl oligopeptidase PreP (S9A serine peptidase family)